MVYGYCTGTVSCRKLAAQTRTLIPMMWLAGDQHPDFRTISDFRKEHLEAIAELFSQFLQLARTLGMLKTGIVSVDGSKLKANASKHKAMSAERLQQKIPEVRAQVQRLLQQAEEADAREDTEHGDEEGNTLPADGCTHKTAVLTSPGNTGGDGKGLSGYFRDCQLTDCDGCMA